MTPPRKKEELDHAAKLRSFQRQTGSTSIEEAKYCVSAAHSPGERGVSPPTLTRAVDADVDEKQGELAAAVAAFRADGAGLPPEGQGKGPAESSGEQGACCIA